MKPVRAFSVTALVSSVIVAALLAQHTAAKQVAIATAVILLATSALLILARPRITHASTVFMALFIIYGSILPWLYVTGTVPFDQGSFFVHDWNLLTRGNLIAEAGLVAYGVGLWVGRRSKWPRPPRVTRTLSYETGRTLVVALAIIGAVAWIIMFAHEGFPLSSLVGRPPHDRARIAAIAAGGWGYFNNLSYASDIAFLIYVWMRPKRSFLTPSMLALLGLIWVSNGLIGSRLLLVMPIIGAVYIRVIQSSQGHRRDVRAPRVLTTPQVSRARLAQLVLAVTVLFVVTMAYETYRIGQSGNGGSQQSVVYHAANSFSTAGTFYLVLDKVPTQFPYWHGHEIAAPILYLVPYRLDPSKYNQIWDAIRFTKDFYGYDETQNYTSAEGPDLLADSYINGGLVGVLLIMLLLGMCNEYITRAQAAHPTSPLIGVAFVLYTTIFLQEVLKTGFFAAITFSDIRFLPLLVVPWCLHRIYVVTGPSDVDPDSDGPADRAPILLASR